MKTIIYLNLPKTKGRPTYNWFKTAMAGYTYLHITEVRPNLYWNIGVTLIQTDPQDSSWVDGISKSNMATARQLYFHHSEFDIWVFLKIVNPKNDWFVHINGL